MDQSISTPQRPTSHAHSRSFSLRSDKSGEQQTPSSNEKADKARRDSFLRGESKANPNSALKELQPGAAALLEKNTLNSIRDVQHKDAEGNVITEPDLSNPTRPRWERPLDTIRSFEKAIDGGYKRRSTSRADTYDSSNNYTSRRSSYFGGYDSGPSPSRQSQVGSGYYGGGRPDSYAEYNNGQGGPPRQRYGPRGTSDSAVNRLNGSQRGYSQHGHQQSRDTAVTNGSDSTGPWNNSTDPSSESSSPDRYHTGERKQHNVETYGYDSHGGGPILEDHATDDRVAYPQRMQQAPNGYTTNGGSPAVPAHAAGRVPIKLGGAGGGGGADSVLAGQTGTLPSTSRPVEEKRKSWLKRRFSKNE